MAFATVRCDVIDQSKECLIHYLRSQNLDDVVFDATPREAELSDSCVRRIKSEKDSVFIEAHRKFERVVENQESFDCFMNSIRNNDEYKNLLLKKKAIESVKLSWKAKLNPKNWVPGPKSKAKSTTASEIEEIEQNNLFVCEFEKKFQDDFDLIAEARTNTSRDDEQCIRSFLERSGEQEQAPISDINCSATLDRKKLEIIRKLRALYAHYQRSLRKCMDEALATEDFYSPEFRALIRNRTTKSVLQTQEKKVYVEDMLKLFKTVKSKCRG